MYQVDGLFQGPTALSQDFGEVLYRIQLLGFNVIRVPFSFQVSTFAYTLAVSHSSHEKIGAQWSRTPSMLGRCGYSVFLYIQGERFT